MKRNITELKRKIRKIKLIVTDMDGVLTDGKVWFGSNGEEYKSFSFSDIMGFSMLKKSGYKLALVTGEKNAIVDNLVKKLGIRDVFQGEKNKLRVVEKLTKKYQLSFSQVCYIGDDINDIPSMKEVGFSVSVSNGQKQVKKVAVYVTKKDGGNGALREVSDLILGSLKIKC